jgi:intracellular multiplication protein IcmE
MLARIKEPLAKLSNYPRLRILLIIAVVILVFIFLMNILSSKTTNTPTSSVQPVSANSSQTKKSVSEQASNQYNQLQATSQKQQLQSAVNSGGTLFEGAFNGQTNKDTGTANNAAPANTSTNSSTQTPPTSTQQAANQQTNAGSQQLQQQLTQLQQKLDQQKSDQQNQSNQDNQVNQIENNMRSTITNLTGSWTLPTAATVEAAAPTASTPASSGTGPVIIKAGSILFAVLDTALDSDQPGTPVMATIVTGPYKGTRLLGAFQAEQNALVVQFSNMSMPTMNKTIGINAYALDQNTANNAIATSVDHHYLLRYGMLFASAFMQGFGNAYQNYNYTCPPGTANCTLINSNGTPNTQATTKTAAYQGLGQVGTTLSQVAAQQFNTPTTIKVDQGTGRIGVLFMNDVALPAN